MGLLEDCETLFGTYDLFKVLSLSRDADESKIKKAYYKMSLKVHPDKSTEDNLAENTQKFQVLSKIHKILSDKGSREVSSNFISGQMNGASDIGLKPAIFPGMPWAY